MIPRTVLTALAFFGMTTNVCAGEVQPNSNFSVQKVLFISGNYAANTADRGEIWVIINQSVSALHSGCGGGLSQSGYLVASFADDAFAKQYVAGLLTAKTSGTAIRIGIDDSRKNSRGMCFLSYYELQP